MPNDERARLRSTFGAVLRSERGAARTQAELAAATRMNEVTVKRLESGRRRPTMSSIWRLARALRPHGTLRDRVGT